MSRKYSQNELKKLANSPDYDSMFDDLYEEEVISESKQRKKEQIRYGIQED